MWATEWFMKYQIQHLEEENRKLKEDLENMRDYCSNLDSENDEQALEIEDLKREIEKLKWLQICWKTVVERIEDDKKVVRE